MLELRTKDGFCLACGGYHEEDPDDCYIDFKGYRFRKPFYCMCCGIEICARQFAFGRACGKCDIGLCQSWHRNFTPDKAHAHPQWYIPFNAEQTLKLFAEFTKAEKLEETDHAEV